MNAALRAKRILRALDPNDDPSAEPVSPLALAALAILTGVSVFLFLRWRFQPMQDMGLHASMAAVIAHYGEAGSIYPAIYKLDLLNTNSLFCTTAGLLGRILPPWTAFRLVFALYLAGIPLANLYALRTFGRSAWGAVVAVPLCYNVMYVYGFASFMFATPLAVLAIPLFYRLLVKPTIGRGAAVATVLVLLFLTHWHVFLWTGVLLFTMALVGILVTAKKTLFGLPGTRPWTIAWVSAAAVVPSIALLTRWVWRSTKPPPADEFTLMSITNPSWQSFVRGIKPPSRSISEFWGLLDLTKNEGDARFFVWFFVLGILCIAIARMHKWKRPPVLELACAVTCASYFFMAEDFAGQQVIASRQFGFGLYFAAVFFTPVPGSVSRLGRLTAVVAVTCLASLQLSNWARMLTKFEKEEVAGLEEVLAAAPPRKRLHYIKIEPDSKYFTAHAFWHVEKNYMLDKGGQVDENPAYYAMMPIRYRSAYTPHIIDAHVQSWPGTMEIWENFDLVLVHKWKPAAADLATAQKYGERIIQKGDWELWKSNVPQKR